MIPIRTAIRLGVIPFAITAVSVCIPVRDANAQSPIEGGIRYGIAQQAKYASANTFGAATAFEREIQPNTSRPGSWLIRLSAHNVFDATYVPGNCITEADPFGRCGGSELVKIPVSLFTVQGTFAYRWDRFGVFYSGSVTKAQLSTTMGTVAEGTMLNTFGAFYLYNPFLGPVATVADLGSSGLESAEFDYVAGASYDLTYINAYAGYVGSQGFFTNLTQQNLRLFLTSLISDQFSQFSFFKMGIDKLAIVPSLLSNKGAGLTSAYVRRLQVVPPQGQAAVQINADTLRDAATYALTTVHAEQLSVMQIADIIGAVSASPKVGFHQLIAAVHTPNFHKVLDTKQTEASSSLYNATGGIVKIGMVNVPAQPYYAAPGGTYFHFAAEIRGPGGRLALRFNDPDILAVFPFATNSVSFNWTLGVASSDFRESL